ncbi:hypothetical protein IFR04_016222 [Cadophora malorum]|uniref:CYTH domain-containing protein n=1 Tax=Cadophora malorum TaxID=108018 RepID=A0A8H7T1N4_9HELO|nr:hypothetical protein IFR04_016222 [Cadophora malorum]
MANISLSKSVTLSGMIPKYEVKLLLKPSETLDSNYQLSRSIKDTFSVTAASQKMHVQFLDTNDKHIFERDWSARIRKIDTDNELELTYKKRYKILDGKIDAALMLAAQNGFDSNNSVFEAQVDWGFKNQTLSIHRDEAYAHSQGQGGGGELPQQDDAREMLVEKAPERFNSEIDPAFLKQARIYGPIVAERFAGTYDGDDLDIEVWPIRTIDGTGFDYFVEVSFKVRKYAKAAKRRTELMELLEKKGWFLAKDLLKTTLIMKRYAPDS